MRTFSLTGRDADWQAVDVELDGHRLDVHGARSRRHRGRRRRPAARRLQRRQRARRDRRRPPRSGFDTGRVAAGIAAGGGVPGRLERVDAGQDFVVVVDYAHKPDAVEAALRTLRPLTDGRVIVVIGAGGDRDPGKRPIMGEIAARLADVLVVTDDNPRTEDPAAIRAAVLVGRARRAAPRCSRSATGGAAIREAVRRARPGDIVLVAGKGHETGQEVAGVRAPVRRPRGRPRRASAEELAAPMIPMTLREIAAVGRRRRRRRPRGGRRRPGVRRQPQPRPRRALRRRGR